MKVGTELRQRRGPAACVIALAVLVLCAPASLARRSPGEGLLLYRAVSAAEPGAIDLNVVGAPAGALVQIRLFLGVPEHEQAPSTLLFQGTAHLDGSLCIPLDRASLRQAGLAQVSVQAQCFDPEDGSTLRSNLTTLTTRPTLHLLLESFDGSPREPRVVEYDPVLDALEERVGGLLGAGFQGLDARSTSFDVHAASGAVFYVPSNAESTLARAGSDDDPLAHVGFGNQRVLDVAFTRDQSALTVLTESTDGLGRTALSLHSIEVGSLRAERGRTRSSGPLFTAQQGACDAWLVPSDDSRRVFVVLRDESGLDRIQQWVLGERLVEGCRISPIRRYGERIQAVRAAGEFLATVNVDRSGGNARLQVFHLTTNTRVLELDVAGDAAGLELWTDGDSRAEVSVLSRADGGSLQGATVDLRADEVATVHPLLPLPGARHLAGSRNGAWLFVATDQGAVLRIDRRSGQVAGSVVRGLEQGIRRFGVLGDGEDSWLFVTTPVSAGSPSEALHCYALDPVSGRRLGPGRQQELGGTATRILTH